MTISVHIPRPLRVYSDGTSDLPIEATTVRAALEQLEQTRPSLYRSVCDETGALRRHVNLFVNNDHVRDRQGFDTPLSAGDVLFILPAVSGG